jgi:hypothetical protein
MSDSIGGLMLVVLTIAASLQAIPTIPLFIFEGLRNIKRGGGVYFSLVYFSL